MKFRVRIDDVNDVAKTIKEWAGSVSCQHVVVHHLVNANSHFHAYLDAPMIMSPQALRYKIKTTFKLEKVAYSVGICDEERVPEYIQYLFNTKHGNVATIHATNVDHSIITAARNAAHVVSEEYAKSRTSRKSLTLYDIACEVRATVSDDQNITQIVHMTIRLLHKYCKCHDRFLVTKVVDTVRSMVDPSEYAEFILKSLI